MSRTTGQRRTRVSQWRLLVPVTVLALILSPLAQVAMRAADGDLDPTFGTGGLVTIDFGSSDDTANAVAIQADGRILLTGRVPDVSGADFVVARLHPDGSLDQTFGVGGTVRTDVNGEDDTANAIAIQPDGKIVVAGVAGRQFGLARYNADGSLDTTFDGDGKVVTAFDTPSFEGAVGVALQHDGRIVVAGTVLSQTGLAVEVALVRYAPNGSLDASFDGDGRVTTDIGPAPDDIARDVLIDGHGRIVVVGVTNSEIALVRYRENGALDPSFDQDGKVITPFPQASAFPRAGALQADGRIVVAGGVAGLTGSHFMLARYEDSGALDATFGTNGTVVTDFADGAVAFSLALQRDGKIVAAGFTSAPHDSAFALARYNVDGSLDATFGSGGTVTTDFAPGARDFAFDVAIQRNGAIVAVGGSAAPQANGEMAAVRYEAAVPHTLTFFLHGQDVPGTATGFTMNDTAPVSQPVLVKVGSGVSWFSNPVVDGTFAAGSTFEVVLPCTLGVSFPKSVRLASTDATGHDEQTLGHATDGLRLCRTQTIAIAVTTPATLENRRLKLTIASALPADVLHLGDRTFLRATSFVGVP